MVQIWHITLTMQQLTGKSGRKIGQAGRTPTKPLPSIATKDSTTKTSSITKVEKPAPPSVTRNVNVKPGYVRRKEAAQYLGISMRTLTDWQQKRVIPFVDVSHRVTLFKRADLDQSLSRYIVKAIGEKT